MVSNGGRGGGREEINVSYRGCLKPGAEQISLFKIA